MSKLRGKGFIAKVLDNFVTKTGTVTYTDGESYGGDWVPTLKKCGKVVQFSGAFKPKAQVAAGATLSVGTIPVGFRPSSRVLVLCQGSNFAIWNLDIFTNGSIRANRYRTGSTAEDMQTTNWLVFNTTWITND